MAVTTTDIHAAADALAGRGKRPTLAAVRAELGAGSFSTIGEAMQSWKAPDSQQAPTVAAPDAVVQRATELASQVWAIAREEAEQRMQLERDTMEQQRLAVEAARTEAMEAADVAVTQLDEAQRQLDLVRAERDALQQQVAVVQAQLAESTARAQRAEQLAHDARTAETEAREAAAALRGKLEAIGAQRKPSTT